MTKRLVYLSINGQRVTSLKEGMENGGRYWDKEKKKFYRIIDGKKVYEE